MASGKGSYMSVATVLSREQLGGELCACVALEAAGTEGTGSSQFIERVWLQIGQYARFAVMLPNSYKAPRRPLGHIELGLDPAQEMTMPELPLNRRQITADLDDIFGAPTHPDLDAFSRDG